MFQWSRDALPVKRKELVAQGRGNKPNACREVTLEEENKQSGQFGCQEPLALQLTLWWFLSLHFGLRARDESKKLCWGDVSLEKDPDTENEMLVWKAERGTKTRKGQEEGRRREFNPKLQATNTERCPVRCYKLFASKRPKSMLKPDSPFYLTVNIKKRVPRTNSILTVHSEKMKLAISSPRRQNVREMKETQKVTALEKQTLVVYQMQIFQKYLYHSYLVTNMYKVFATMYKHPSMIHQRQMSESLSGGAKRFNNSEGASFHENEFQTASKIMRCEESHQVYLTERPKITEVTPQNASVTDSSHMSFASQMFSAATLNNCTIQIMPGNF